MTDQTEERLRDTYGDLEPGVSKESLLAGLPQQVTLKSPLPRLLLAVAAVAAGVVALIAFRPGADRPTPPPGGPRLLFVVTEDAAAVARVMKSRLDDRGMAGAKVEVNDAGDRVAVHLPANASPFTARALLVRPGVLQFRLVVPIEPTEEAPANTEWVHDADTGKPLLVELPGNDRDDFGGEDLDPEGLSTRPSGYGRSFVVTFALLPDRQEDFMDFTRRSVRRQLAVILDGRVICAPVIMEALPGRGQISGGGAEGYSHEEAGELAAILKSGPLPAEVTPVEPR
jgi:preprotein translocase subunit SecD